MLNGAIFGGLTDQQTAQTSFSSLREENEEELKAEFDYESNVADRLPGSPSLYKSKSEGDFGDLAFHNDSISHQLAVKHPSEGSGLSMLGGAPEGPLLTTDTLSSTFRYSIVDVCGLLLLLYKPNYFSLTEITFSAGV